MIGHPERIKVILSVVKKIFIIKKIIRRTDCFNIVFSKIIFNIFKKFLIRGIIIGFKCYSRGISNIKFNIMV